jgi:AmmeMemoRadiSam system protein A
MTAKPPPDLGESERSALLAFACGTVSAAVRDQRPPPEPADPALQDPRGVFVTLQVGGRLRGCLGHIEPDEPLVVATGRMARAVVSEDPRFAAVRPDELPGMTVEVSVLSPLFASRPEEVVPGVHGLLIRRGRHAGLLLPQVATEHRLDRTAFLEALCQKAHLPPDAWSAPDTTLHAFTVQHFATSIPS